jgi:hypothetical protein
MRNMARVACAGWLAAVLLATGGCGQQLGALLYYITPEPKNKADFKFGSCRLAILIDDPYGSLPRSDLRVQLHNSLVQELDANKVPVTVVPLADMAKVEQNTRDFDNMSIRAVGEKVHADQVLHVLILSFTAGEDAAHGVYRGTARAAVKVCSTERKPAVRVWPPGGEGYVVEVQQPSEQVDEWGSKRAGDVYADAITERLGKRIAMLFYEHSAEAEKDLATGRTEKPAR